MTTGRGEVGGGAPPRSAGTRRSTTSGQSLRSRRTRRGGEKSRAKRRSRRTPPRLRSRADARVARPRGAGPRLVPRRNVDHRAIPRRRDRRGPPARRGPRALAARPLRRCGRREDRGCGRLYHTSIWLLERRGPRGGGPNQRYRRRPPRIATASTGRRSRRRTPTEREGVWRAPVPAETTNGSHRRGAGPGGGHRGCAPGLMLARGPAALVPDWSRGGTSITGRFRVDGTVADLLRAGGRAPSPPVRCAAAADGRTGVAGACTTQASGGLNAVACAGGAKPTVLADPTGDAHRGCGEKIIGGAPVSPVPAEATHRSHQQRAGTGGGHPRIARASGGRRYRRRPPTDRISRAPVPAEDNHGSHRQGAGPGGGHRGCAPGLMLGSRGPAALVPDWSRGGTSITGRFRVDGTVADLLRAGGRAPSPPVRCAAAADGRTGVAGACTTQASGCLNAVARAVGGQTNGTGGGHHGSRRRLPGAGPGGGHPRSARASGGRRYRRRPPTDRIGGAPVPAEATEAALPG